MSVRSLELGAYGFPTNCGNKFVVGRIAYACTAGVTLNRRNMHIDHIYPVEHGGSNDAENLQALCAGCNMRKASKRIMSSESAIVIYSNQCR